MLAMEVVCTTGSPAHRPSQAEVMFATDAERFVDLAYRRHLLHPPDRRSSRTYRYLLHRGMTRSEVVLRLVLSAEGRLQRESPLDATLALVLAPAFLLRRRRRVLALIRRGSRWVHRRRREPGDAPSVRSTSRNPEGVPPAGPA